MSCEAHKLAATRLMLEAADVDLIQSIVRAFQPQYVVDLGAGSGTTALAVLAASPDVHVTTVDVDEDNLNWAALAIENAGFTARWARVKMDAAAYAGDDNLIPPGLLLIDTSHEEDATRRELDAWLPLLRHGTPIWLHDYVGEPGVKVAVDALVAARRVTVLEQAGLGIAVQRV